MIIFNQTSKLVVSDNAKLATSFSDQILGLLNPASPRALVFHTRFGIHTFGLNTPIDVVVLDHGNKVVKLKVLKPWRIFVWNPMCDTVIELPEGSIRRAKIKLKDQLSLKD